MIQPPYHLRAKAADARAHRENARALEARAARAGFSVQVTGPATATLSPATLERFLEIAEKHLTAPPRVV